MKIFIISIVVLSLLIDVLQPKKYLVETKNKENNSKPCACPRIIDPVCGTDGKDNLIRIESFHLYVQAMSIPTNVRQNAKESKFSARENVLVRNHVKLLGISDQCVELTVSSGVFDKHHF